jgi:hypothetical protein
MRLSDRANNLKLGPLKYSLHPHHALNSSFIHWTFTQGILANRLWVLQL